MIMNDLMIILEGEGLCPLNLSPHLSLRTLPLPSTSSLLISTSSTQCFHSNEHKTMKASSQKNYGAVCINDGDANAVATTEQEQPMINEPIEECFYENSISFDNKRHHRVLTSILGLVVAFAVIAVVMGSPPSANNALRGDIQMEVFQAVQADAGSGGSYDITDPAADQPQPDYNGEGRYNWQKCKDSDDPNCWKNEGERVGGYWKNFGQRMKTYWMGFRQKMHDLFAGKDVDANDSDATTATTTSTIAAVNTTAATDAGDADATTAIATASEREKTGKKKGKSKENAAASSEVKHATSEVDATHVSS